MCLLFPGLQSKAVKALYTGWEYGNGEQELQGSVAEFLSCGFTIRETNEPVINHLTTAVIEFPHP